MKDRFRGQVRSYSGPCLLRDSAAPWRRGDSHRVMRSTVGASLLAKGPVQSVRVSPQPQKLLQLIALGHGIAPAQFDQFAAIPRLEQQVTQHSGPAGLGRPWPAQEHAQGGRQLMPMASGDFVDGLAWGDYQHLYRRQPQLLHRLLGRQQVTE